MESWRRAWQGSQLPVKPLEDIEWVEQHREWISALLDASSASSEAAAESYQALQARWMLDHVRELEEAKRIVEDVEVKALSGVALALTEAAESLSRTAKDLADMRTAEWMIAEQAATYLRCESVEAFVKIAAREGVSKHYLSARAPRYNRAELDKWLLVRRSPLS